jgi:hypothetical protein
MTSLHICAYSDMKTHTGISLFRGHWKFTNVVHTHEHIQKNSCSFTGLVKPFFFTFLILLIRVSHLCLGSLPFICNSAFFYTLFLTHPNHYTLTSIALLAVKSSSDESLRGMAFLTLNWCYHSMGAKQNSIMELFIFLKIYPNIETDHYFNHNNTNLRHEIRKAENFLH